MGRSVKKGPFVQPVLLKRIQEMNKAGEKRILKTWSRASTIFPVYIFHRGSMPFEYLPVHRLYRKQR